ncbi:phosphoribosylamine--glycine ligase [uncultured Thiohalocapsa sp.]|uniref:phosphoribosylamine--glycine ligase n=1 Tax=uncultured Thiohalocapsa sp. TaxID=768990 RepID=UPI0025F78F19|nr:phosphoribosylamine--glycine ligase [uncultured Thiohalocapsa sp.]
MTAQQRNILVVGGGGREHALAWKLAQSPQTACVYVAPGNGGTATEPGVENVPIAATDIEALVAFAGEHAIDLTVVGPEAPLVAGIVDAFEAAGHKCFGPRRAAAQLEGSKAFAKDFMVRHGIPTAQYRTFHGLDAALDHLQQVGAPVVIKADGLAAGKGVILAEDLATAEAAVRDMLTGNRFGAAGATVVIEEWLRGREVSYIALVDGSHILPLASSQDHKARDDGGRGPNTGGMGAFSPSPLVTPALEQRILDEVMRPTMAGLAADGLPYVGFLYAGLMITEDGGPRVLEYNCRLGDPETQPILMRLDTDLLTLIDAALAGALDQAVAEWHPQTALCVVLAAGGYPGDYERGVPIQIAPDATGAKLFHAGTRLRDSVLESDGGRILCAAALGDALEDARRRAYRALQSVALPGGFYRRDIGRENV